MEELLEEWRPMVDAAIESLLPRDIDEAYLNAYFGEASYEYDAAAIQVALSDPVWELLDRGGKRWRPIICLLMIDGFGGTPEEYVEYACIPEILHNGTIIVDDVEDRAELRRGEPALHHQYGLDVALNAGNAMYFLPLKVIAHNPANLAPERRLELYEMFMYELNRTHLGQGMDIYWHNHPDVEITEAQYLEMCACKTGCLGRMVARIAAILCEQPADVEQAVAQYAESMSIAFQIGDDILDIKHSLDQAGDFGKAFGNDIREGKKTLMVIHSMQTAEGQTADRLAAILQSSENSDEEIMEAIEILQSTDSISYARERAREFASQAQEELEEIEMAPERATQLRKFAEFVVERQV